MITAEQAEKLLESPQLLDKLLVYQYKLQARYGTWEKIRDNPAARQNFVNQMLLAMQEETVEIMRETAYKNPDFVEFGWKRGQQFNEEGFRNEIIDQLHFWLILAIVAGFKDGDDIASAYALKNSINHERQDQGY